jgi:hypothetical protein
VTTAPCVLICLPPQVALARRWLARRANIRVRMRESTNAPSSVPMPIPPALTGLMGAMGPPRSSRSREAGDPSWRQDEGVQQARRFGVRIGTIIGTRHPSLSRDSVAIAQDVSPLCHRAGARSTIRYRLAGATGPTGACRKLRHESPDASDTRACTRVIIFGGRGEGETIPIVPRGIGQMWRNVGAPARIDTRIVIASRGRQLVGSLDTQRGATR